MTGSVAVIQTFGAAMNLVGKFIKGSLAQAVPDAPADVAGGYESGLKDP
jgi:hypothetical protein